VSNSVYRILDNGLTITRWLMSPVCLLCGGRSDADGLCEGCNASLPRLTARHCPVCALPDATGERCGRCLTKPPHFDRVVAPFRYEFPATVLIQGLKYRGNLACARPLAAGLAAALETEPYPDLIVPMPLARARLAARGFNQAMEISRRLATEFGLDISLPANAGRRCAGSPAMEATRDQCARCLCVRLRCERKIRGRRGRCADHGGDARRTGAHAQTPRRARSHRLDCGANARAG